MSITWLMAWKIERADRVRTASARLTLKVCLSFQSPSKESAEDKKAILRTKMVLTTSLTFDDSKGNYRFVIPLSACGSSAGRSFENVINLQIC
jgi:hypothetical protein